MIELRVSLIFAVLVCVFTSSNVKGIEVEESDIPITEGSTREIFVRRQNLDSSMTLTVFVTTIEGYRQRQQTQCNITLPTLLGSDESQVDPAEDGDLLTREYSLLYEPETFEASLMLEVVDDNIAENEEIFIIYTGVVENPGDICARVVRLQDNDVVQFNFSAPLVEISEGDDLPSQLSIVKNGQNEPNISFQVTITAGTSGLNENDYTPNADHTYVFTSETNELPIATQLGEDRSGESIESFFIDFPARFSPTIAQSVVPTRAEVRIIDDDSVLIGYQDSYSSVTLVEGRPAQTVCVDIKPTGLPLDPFDYIPLTIRTESLDSEVNFGREQFEFSSGRTITCKTINAIDDGVSDGTQTSQLIIDVLQGTSVPVVVHPDSIPITIMDIDVISFELIVNTNQSRDGPQVPPSLIEGNRTQNFIRIMRTGRTIFAYNVTLKVEPLTESSNPSKILITPITMGVSDNETDVHLEIPENKLSEKVMQYRISIASIEPFQPGSNTGSSQGALTDVIGEGTELLVYDNDFNISFTSSSVTVAEGSREKVCVMIQGLDMNGVYPTLTIPLSITIQNTSSIGGLHISTRQITLFSSRNNTCFYVEFPADNDVCDQSPRTFTIQLMSAPDPEYTVIFLQQTITVKIDDVQDCVSAVCGACIAVPIIIILLIILLLVIAAIIFWRYYKHSKRYHPKYTEEKRNKYLASQLEKAGGNGLESTDSIVPMDTLPDSKARITYSE